MDGPTRTCPYCAETIRAEAIKCRYCGSRLDRGSLFSRSWYRRREGKLIGGVCAGLAAEWGISVTLIRVAFVLATFFGGGFTLPLYIALWVIMPMAPAAALPPAEQAYDRKPGGFPPEGQRPYL